MRSTLADDIAQAADDAVVVEARNVVERFLDLGLRQADAGFALFGVGRIVSGVKQLDQKLRNIGISRQRLLHVLLAELDRGLAQIFRRRAQDRHIAPGKLGADDEAVEAVALGVAGDDGAERFFQRLLDVLEGGRATIGALHLEVEYDALMRPSGVVAEADIEGILGDHLQAEIFEDRQRGRQRHHFAEQVELQPKRIVRIVGLAIGAGLKCEPAGPRGDLLQFFEIVHRFHRREHAAIAGREMRLALLQQPRALGVAMPRGHGFGEAVVPGADGAADLLFELMHADMRARAVVAADDVMHARQHRNRRWSASRPTCGR